MSLRCQSGSDSNGEKGVTPPYQSSRSGVSPPDVVLLPRLYFPGVGERFFTLAEMYSYGFWFGCLFGNFLCLMAHQPSWVTQCQTHPCRRTVVVLIKP